MASISDQIKEHIVAEFLAGQDTIGLTNETRLIDEEVIDSLGIFLMVGFIGDRFGVEIEPEEVTIENFEKGLDDLVAAEHQGKYVINTDIHPGAPVATLNRQVTSMSGGHDVVILSLFPDVVGKGHLDKDALRDNAREFCQTLKNNGTYVLILNTSTYEDSDLVSNYYNSVDDTPSLRAHKVGAIVLDLSHELGVSIIDADRLLAEMGAKGNVESIGRYSVEATKVVCDEIFRILSDYGYFEERPLVLQAGARK